MVTVRSEHGVTAGESVYDNYRSRPVLSDRLLVSRFRPSRPFERKFSCADHVVSRL
jgi:hypothetical protein